MTFLITVLVMISCFILMYGILSGNMLFLLVGIVGFVIFGYSDYYLIKNSKRKTKNSNGTCDWINILLFDTCDEIDCSDIDFIECDDIDCN